MSFSSKYDNIRFEKFKIPTIFENEYYNFILASFRLSLLSSSDALINDVSFNK